MKFRAKWLVQLKFVHMVTSSQKYIHINFRHNSYFHIRALECILWLTKILPRGNYFPMLHSVKGHYIFLVKTCHQEQNWTYVHIFLPPQINSYFVNFSLMNVLWQSHPSNVTMDSAGVYMGVHISIDKTFLIFVIHIYKWHSPIWWFSSSVFKNFHFVPIKNSTNINFYQ